MAVAGGGWGGVIVLVLVVLVVLVMLLQMHCEIKHVCCYIQVVINTFNKNQQPNQSINSTPRINHTPHQLTTPPFTPPVTFPTTPPFTTPPKRPKLVARLPDLLTALSLDVVASAAELPSLRLDVLNKVAAGSGVGLQADGSSGFSRVVLPRLALSHRDRVLWAEDADE